MTYMQFRSRHLLQILSLLKDQKLPIDVFLNQYYRSNKAIGSKDRQYISDKLYEYIRWKGLIDYTKSPLDNFDPSPYLADQSIPVHIRASFPEKYFQYLVDAYGEAKALSVAFTSNTRAPLTIRVNTLKTTRESLFEKWKGKYDVQLCQFSEWGINFYQKINFATLLEFQQGLFEVQDEASQLIAKLVCTKPKEHVLDFCAGAGGKSLAFAPLMENKGQIYLHDIRPKALLEAKKRMNRAGIQNVQFTISPKLKRSMDWVLVDAPCSGSGTLRRNPDMKWKFDFQAFPNLLAEQRNIFENALSYLKDKGKIVYATCSIFPDENGSQASYFMDRFNLRQISTFQSFPEKDGMDGFYGAVFEKKL